MSDLVPARELSKTFFGRESRLSTWHTVMGFRVEPPEPFRAKDIFDKMHPDANAGMIGKELGALAAAGAITPLPELDTLPSKYYRRLDSAMWPVIAELADRTIELSQAVDSDT